MAPEQGPDSKSRSEKTLPAASEEGSDSNNDNGRSDSVGWIYLLRKEQLIEQCKNAGIVTTGYTVDHLRKKLAESLRLKRLRASTEDILRELEAEIRTSENSVIAEEGISVIVSPSHIRSISDMDIMSTVQKWSLQFTGDSDVMEFLERFEELAECHQISRDRLLPSMLCVLGGNALRWYRIKRKEIHSWSEFRSEVEKFFLPRRHLAQIEQNFYNRKQHARERAKDYVLSMLTLARQHPILRAQDHLERIYDGLRSEYRHYIRRHDFTNLDELTALTDDFEALKREEKPQTVHMLVNTGYRREDVCWRCKRTGHRRNTCSAKPKIFCSYCGKDGVLSRTCKCHRPETGSTSEQSCDDNRYHVPVTVNNLKVIALVDTGASRTYISRRIRKHLEGMGIKADHGCGVVQLSDRSLATSLKVFHISITYKDKTINLETSEIPSLAEDVILGMDFLSACGIEIHLSGSKILRPEIDKSVPEMLHMVTSQDFLTTEENNRMCQLFDTHGKGFKQTTTIKKRYSKPKPNKPDYKPKP